MLPGIASGVPSDLPCRFNGLQRGSLSPGEPGGQVCYPYGVRALAVIALLAAGTAMAAPARAVNAWDRAMGKGGVWEQRMIPCDRAGVHLALKKDKTFSLRIETRCQSQRDTTQLAGKFATDGADRLELSFDNAGGAAEAMGCRFATCADSDEDCLTCMADEVSFTLQVVRRGA
jgi:hypothetical protein